MTLAELENQNKTALSQLAGFLYDDNSNQKPTTTKKINWQLLQVVLYLRLLDGNDDDYFCATKSFCIIGHQQVIF